MVRSENFHFKPFPDSRIKREREIAPKERSNPEPRALRLCTFRLRCLTSTSNHTLRLRQQTQSPDHAFDFAEIAPRRHRSHRSHWDRNWEIVGFWWIWLDLIIFFFVGFCFCVYLLRNGIIYLFGNWENVRNKKKMCFLYYF